MPVAAIGEVVVGSGKEAEGCSGLDAMENIAGLAVVVVLFFTVDGSGPGPGEKG